VEQKHLLNAGGYGIQANGFRQELNWRAPSDLPRRWRLFEYIRKWWKGVVGSTSGLGKHPDNKPDDSDHQNRSDPDSGFENISGYLTASETYNRNNQSGG
jgi:hypothetical protein